MRRITVLIAVAAATLVLAMGPASAQTNTTLPLPAGQGGPDNGVPAVQGGAAPGGQVNPATNAGPAVNTEDDSSLAPWLVGAAVLVLLGAGAALVLRRTANRREPSYS